MAETKPMILTVLESKREASRQRVVAQARTIARSLARFADALANDPETPVNNLGELQGRGVMFDAYCAEYATLVTVIDDLAKLSTKP